MASVPRQFFQEKALNSPVSFPEGVEIVYLDEQFRRRVGEIAHAQSAQFIPPIERAENSFGFRFDVG